MVGGGHNLVLSLGLGDGNARTRELKRGRPKKDGKNNNITNSAHTNSAHSKLGPYIIVISS